MIYEIISFCSENAVISAEEWSVGTIEERYVDAFVKYIVEECDYVEEEPKKKYSLRTIDKRCSRGELDRISDVQRKDVSGIEILEVVHFIELREVKGFVTPENFDSVVLTADDDLAPLYRRVAKGFWVDPRVIEEVADGNPEIYLKMMEGRSTDGNEIYTKESFNK